MVNIYRNNKLTNYSLGRDEWIRLGQYSLHKKSSKFILKNNKGKVLGEYDDLLDGVLALIETKKGEKNEQ